MRTIQRGIPQRKFPLRRKGDNQMNKGIRFAQETGEKRRNAVKRSIVCIAIGFSVLLPGLPKRVLAQIPGAETNSAPAAASLGGIAYTAWMGKSTPTDNVWYYPNGAASQQAISGTSTFAAPALASNGDTLYLAWAAPSTGNIYYMTDTGSGWSAASGPVSEGSVYAVTLVPPALAVNGSTLYLAWSNFSPSGEIEVASNAGSGWTFLGPIPGVNAGARTAPALAIYDDTVFVAWLVPGGSQVNYATRPLSGGSWSVNPYLPPATVTSVAPALGVYTYSSTLYLAWTGTSGISYSEWNGAGWNLARSVTLPVAQLTPALVSSSPIVAVCPNPVVDNMFSVVYASPSSSGDYNDLYTYTLISNKVGRCTCHGTGCF
jgi:hypothetical protein